MKHLLVGLVFCLVNSTSNLYAFEAEGIITDSGIKITPLFETGFKYDDNIFNRPFDQSESIISTFAPSVEFLQDDGINSYLFNIAAEKGIYNASSDDDYLDLYLDFAAHVEAGTLYRWDLAVGANRLTEARGTGITQFDPNQFAEALEYDTQNLDATFEYGALTTQMRIAFELIYFNKNYKDFRAITAARSYDVVSVGSTFFYSTNSKTDAFIEVSKSSIRYDARDPSGLSRNSDDERALLGVKWQASAFLTSTVKVGQQRKNFFTSGREDFSGLSWSLGVDWKPLTYSTFSLAAGKAAKDPFLQGDYIDETSVDIAWKHSWNQDFHTEITYSKSDEEFGGFGINRNDDSDSLNFSLNYGLLRWLEVEFFVQFQDKNSSRADLTFEKSVVGINFLMSI